MVVAENWTVLPNPCQEEEEEELRVQGPSVNEVSFHARPHHNVHRTLGVDTGATGPLKRVDFIEWEGDRD
jgi:hypothetical protein